MLLFRDMAVIPALALIPILAGAGGTSDDWAKIALKVAAFGGMLIGGRFLLRPLFRYIAASGVRGSSPPRRCCWCSARRCLWKRSACRWRSAPSLPGCCWRREYRHELEISIEPFKGLLLGLFFISVGMVLNIGVLYTHLAEVLIGVLVLVTVKSGVLYGVSRLFGLRSSVRLQFAGVLSGR